MGIDAVADNADWRDNRARRYGRGLDRDETCRDRPRLAGTAPLPWVRCLTSSSQNSDEMLDIRRLENGLERLGAGSRPTTPPLASPVAIDAFIGPLRYGILMTFLTGHGKRKYARMSGRRSGWGTWIRTKI